jgi:hypothetical protein
MTTIQSTISGYSTETLLTFLLGNVNRQQKAEILEDVKESRELSAFINYLQRLLETNNFDVEVVTKIAEQQMTNLVAELKKFNKELEEETTTERAEVHTFTVNDGNNQVGNNGSNAPHLEKVGAETTTFSIAIAAHSNRLPPTDPLSITGLREAKSPIYELTTAISDEWKRHPLDEKGLVRFLTAYRDELQNNSECVVANQQLDTQKSPFWHVWKWWNTKKVFLILA